MRVVAQEVDEQHDSLQDREGELERGRATDGYQWAGRRDSSTSAAVARVTASRQQQQTHTEAVLLQRQGQHTS